jgi:tetratricopeptide (TPR) repeat protein
MQRMPVSVAVVTCGVLLSVGSARGSGRGEPAARPRAEQLAARGDYRGAIEEYRKAVSETPNDARLHNRLGVCYQKAEEFGAAQKEYQKALKLDPSFAEAYNNLGTVQHARRKYEKAVQSYGKAIEARPSLATAHKNLGTAYLALGRLDEASGAYQRALELDPSAFDPSREETVGVSGVDVGLQYFLLAKIHARSGDLESALAFLNRARKSGYRGFGAAAKDPDFKGLAQDARFVAVTR